MFIDTTQSAFYRQSMCLYALYITFVSYLSKCYLMFVVNNAEQKYFFDNIKGLLNLYW